MSAESTDTGDVERPNELQFEFQCFKQQNRARTDPDGIRLHIEI